MLLNMLLTRYLDSTKLDIRVERCVLSRNRFSSCRNCMEHCPSSAITFDKEIKVNTENCTECMKCTRICPTEVFSDKKYSSKLSLISKQDSIIFSCNKHETKSRSIQLNCIADIDLQMLLMCHISRKKVFILIDDERCTKCKENKDCDVQKTVTKTLIKYNDLVANGVEINYINKDIQQDAIYTRRELIQSFTKKISDDYVMPLIPELTEKERLLNKQTIGLKHNLRNNLIKQIMKECNHEIHQSTLGILMLQNNSSCNGCKKCEAVCPTASLYVEEAGNRFIMKQIASKCVGCQACIEICPTKSLSTNKKYLLSIGEYVSNQPRSILELEVGICNGCGEQTFGTIPMCEACKSKEYFISEDNLWN
ncbi:4Fe-4S binding protein [Bacillus sp. Bva_UNVM-123]|uniref:4Fe-4S binding protein n=1 Tax=Bacillus sp. Bva_UNVM-123 TaxID=2829798 RepID=UPI00391F1BF9